ncbi:DNA-binding MarR family transcriptional regulator [Fontibacillus phaseoli]|uniref:DNA-binding MarR family transcriptional regulator n=1 Tax=Fontibacillus phaseoli TaxID=1416533 RepID=A0A369BVF3_9BACL|nr:MarR family transcriptional regulator [Fontibacillus phaseoli]RCX23594.1 DNA-binding MarR family transcriptional regulator [Fontibacillus phaseoli]
MDEQALDTIEVELAVLYRRISNRKHGNLDRSAYLLLHQINLNGAVGVKALADEFHLDVSTISRQTAALEQKGYVTRTADPADRRAYFLQITELGIQELKQSKKARTERIEQLIRDWTEEEKNIFGELLTRLNRTF